MLGIAGGNSHTILSTIVSHVESIEHCFGHHRISNNTVVTFKTGELLQ